MRSLLIIVGALLLAGGSARTQPPPLPPRPSPMNGLGLSPDQMKRVDAFHKQFGPKMQALERELGEKRRALETLYAQYSLDTAQAQKLNTEINHIQKQILEGHLKLQQDLRKILTSEQFDKLKSGMLRHRQGFGRPPGEGQPPHQH